jgi:hypothetical protein
MNTNPVRPNTTPLRARLGALLFAASGVALFAAPHNANATPATEKPSSIAQTKSKPSIGYCDRCARQCIAAGARISACDPDRFGSCRCSKTEESSPSDPDDKPAQPK